MSVIEQALTNLDNAIGKLENSISQYQTSTVEHVETVKAKAYEEAEIKWKSEAKLKQSDMFSDVDPALVKQKLDSAIKKVEAVLEDAA